MQKKDEKSSSDKSDKGNRDLADSVKKLSDKIDAIEKENNLGIQNITKESMKNTPTIVKAVVEQMKKDPNAFNQNLVIMSALKNEIAPTIEKNINKTILNSIIPQVESKLSLMANNMESNNRQVSQLVNTVNKEMSNIADSILVQNAQYTQVQSSLESLTQKYSSSDHQHKDNITIKSMKMSERESMDNNIEDLKEKYDHGSSADDP